VIYKVGITSQFPKISNPPPQKKRKKTERHRIPFSLALREIYFKITDGENSETTEIKLSAHHMGGRDG